MNKKFVDLMTDYTVEGFAMQMFEKTEANGDLYLHNWYDVKCEDCLTYNDFFVKINWTQEDFNQLMTEYQQLVKDLRIIAQNYDELDGSLEKAKELLLNESVVAAYFIFVAPFDAENNEQLNAQVIGRVGEEPCGYELITHAQRLCKLFSLRAPKQVINNEEKCLFTSLSVHHFASDIEKIDNGEDNKSN